MRTGVVSVVMFLLFLIEGTIVQVFSTEAWGLSWEIIPRFVLVGVVLIGLYNGRRKAVLFGLIFGFMYDIVYTDVLGVYAFTMGLTGYLAGLASRYFHQNWLLVAVTIVLATFFNEWLVYVFYHLFHLANSDLNNLIFREMIPTVIFNAIFALLIFRPMSRLLSGGDREQQMV
jgi:rod shape-determining protein MreD